MTVFIGAGESIDKAEALRQAARSSAMCFDVDPEDLRLVPGSPFSYWVSPAIRQIFRDRDAFARDGRTVRQGLATADDFRFARCWWEGTISSYGVSWFSMAKGGPFSRYYADLPLVINWSQDGREMKNFVKAASSKISSRVQNTEYYFRPGLTWPLRSSRFCPQFLPAQSIISVRGSGIFGDNLDEFLGVASSSIADLLLKIMSGRIGHPQFDMGDIAALPVPDLSIEHAAQCRALARRGWALRRSLDASDETSHAFELPAVLQVDGRALADRVAAWSESISGIEAELADIQVELDRLGAAIYGLSEADRELLAAGTSMPDASEESDDEVDPGEGEPEVVSVSDARELAVRLVSWAVGVGLGRFDLLLALGDRAVPSAPDPFDPLPACSPGMLAGGGGPGSCDPPLRYPVEVSRVLVADAGHQSDITTRVRAVFDLLFGPDADDWWADVGRTLGVRDGDVSSWLQRGFFDAHLKAYSRSRRKAPIVWPLGTRSGSYLVWLYAHCVTGDSLFQILHDIVGPKVAFEDQRLTQLRQDAGPAPTASQRRAVDQQAGFVDELRELAETIEAVAPLWAPDLNDGIVIVLAPLWRLFAHHRAWSKELKGHWTKLAAGDYDWAQLAMHLWPERVIPKCAEDRSLAIAHGLEDVFWVQDDSGSEKWQARKFPTTPADQLIAQRQDPAVAAALAGQP